MRFDITDRHVCHTYDFRNIDMRYQYTYIRLLKTYLCFVIVRHTPGFENVYMSCAKVYMCIENTYMDY